MAYLSPLLNQLVTVIRKSTSSLDRDFSEIEKLQSSVKEHKTFVANAYDKVFKSLKIELTKLKPDCPILDKVPTTGGCFLINPIDGLANFVRGIPYFATTIAYCENGDVKACVVYNRARDEIYLAEKGQGAYKEGFRNLERLRVSGNKETDFASIAINIGYDFGTPEYEKYIGIVNRVKNIRLMGSVSLDMAAVAGGKFDIALSYGNPVSVFAAGLLLIREAGGYIYNKGASVKLDQALSVTDIAGVNSNIGTSIGKLVGEV